MQYLLVNQTWLLLLNIFKQCIIIHLDDWGKIVLTVIFEEKNFGGFAFVDYHVILV